MNIENAVQEIRKQIIEDIRVAPSLKELEDLKVKYLGRKGSIQNLLQELRNVEAEEKPKVGKLINDVKLEVTFLLDEAIRKFEGDALEKRLIEERIDVTLPGRRGFLGRRHVTLNMMDEAIELLVAMGFSVQYGPDIESDFYNFEALNFSKDHPARDMQDTFYITPDTLLRTHTSNTQVRVMEAKSLRFG